MALSLPRSPRSGRSPGRRVFLGCCGAVAAALAVDAIFVEPSWLSITERDVEVPGLDRALSGLRVAHLSDLHLSALGGIHDVVASAVKAFDPQIVAITGDAVEETGALAVLQTFCRALSGPGREVLAVPGNWERWGRVAIGGLGDAYRRVGARLLVNEAARAAGAVVVGVDDGCTENHDVARSFRDARGAAALLLTHAPGILDRLPPETPRFGLALAGHTHGGQITALGHAVWTPPGSGRFVEGMYETAKGPLYVSRGIGTSVIAARLTCRPELVLLRLRA